MITEHEHTEMEGGIALEPLSTRAKAERPSSLGGASSYMSPRLPYVVQQNAFQKKLSQFVNGGFSDRRRALAAFAGIQHAWRREAHPVSGAFWEWSNTSLPATKPAEEIRIAPYSGQQTQVIALRDFVARHLVDDVAFCMIHGSLATGEEMAYSDVDALVVLKDEVVRSPERLSRAARALCRARGLMFAFDALQHHGWFVLTEQDLRCHCEAYFPTVLFRYGGLLVPSGPLHIHVSVRDSSTEVLDAFRQIAAAVRSRVHIGARPANLYDLKVLLSHVMLLPSMYVQIRDGEGIWKGRSFEMARGDFSRKAWLAVESASDARQNWPDHLGNTLPWTYGPIAQMLAKRLAPGIPAALDRVMTDEFCASARALVEEMETKIMRGATHVRPLSAAELGDE